MSNTVKVEQNKAGLGGFIKELQSLDVENYGNWSLPIRLVTWGFIAVLTTGVGFFVGSKPVMSDTASLKVDREMYFQEFREKQTKLAGAEQYAHQVQEIDKKFQEQLQQLPKESEIPGLVDDLNRSGRIAGLNLQDISLGAEVRKEFFIEQPISITAKGDFHSYGRFIQSISALPRIVTIQSFNIESSKGLNNDLPEVTYSINASTYRYLDSKATASPTAQTTEAGSQ